MSKSYPDDPVLRRELARSLRKGRRLDRERAMSSDKSIRETRNRSLDDYYYYLRGLDATLNHVRGLSSPCVVDGGAGTGRALHELSQSRKGVGLDLVGTGIMWDATIVHPNYRVTPVELMRGFGPQSIGCFLSVFGSLLYTEHRPYAVAMIDHLLVPGGVLRVCQLVASTDFGVDAETNAKRRAKADLAPEVLREVGYGVAGCDFEAVVDDGLQKYVRTFAVLWAVKPVGACDPNELAHTLAEKDQEKYLSGLSKLLTEPLVVK